MENNTVYVVLEGEYSSKSIRSVFTDKALADRYVELIPDGYIEEFELNDFTDAHPGLLFFGVTMDADGNVRPSKYSLNPFQTAPDPDRKDYPLDSLYNEGEYFCFWVWAKDDQHAIKIANERRAQMVAEGRWQQAFDDLRAQQSKYKQRSHLETDTPVTLRD